MHYKQSMILPGQQHIEYDHDTDTLRVSNSEGQPLITCNMAGTLALRDFLNTVWPADDNGYERFRPADGGGNPALVQVFLGVAQLSRKMLRLLRALDDSDHKGMAVQIHLIYPLLRHLRAVINISEELATAFLPLEGIRAIVREAAHEKEAGER